MTSHFTTCNEVVGAVALWEAVAGWTRSRGLDQISMASTTLTKREGEGYGVGALRRRERRRVGDP